MNTSRHPLALIGAALAIAAGTPPTRAADEAPSAATPSPGAAAPQAQSRRAVRDQETGRLRAPTADELKAMHESESAARKARGEPEVVNRTPLVVRQHSNGMRSAVLGPDYLMTLKAERRADGKLVVLHSESGSAQPAAPSQRPTE